MDGPPLSKMLTSFKLKSTLDGENLPPSSQNNVTAHEKRNKEATLFDNAMVDLKAFWDGQTFDGFRISSSHHPCNHPPEPFNDYETIHPIVSSGSKAKFLKNADIYEEMSFALKHVYKRPRELSLVKCLDVNCGFCSTHPVSAVKSVEEIRKNRGIMLLPKKSPTQPQHYMTYLELTALSNDMVNLKDNAIIRGKRSWEMP